MTRASPLLASLACVSALACASGAAWAQAGGTPPPQGKPIVKIVTHDGKVIYTDRSPAVPGGRVTEIRRGMTGAVLAEAPASAAARTDDKKAGDKGGNDLVSWAKSQQEALERDKKAVTDAAERLARESCERARQQLKVLSAGGRVARPGDQGERVLLSDDEITKERASTEQAVAQYCK